MSKKASESPLFMEMRKRHLAERAVVRAVSDLPTSVALEVLSAVIRTVQPADIGIRLPEVTQEAEKADVPS